MMDVNKVFLLGRLGGDPVVRETKNGSGMATFSVATTRKWRDEATAAMKEETDWHRVVTWGKLSDQCGKYLQKGSPVHVEGMLRARKYEPKPGDERTIYEIHADHVRFLPRYRKPEETEAVADSQVM